MSTKTDIQRNKLMHLENTLVILWSVQHRNARKTYKTIHALHGRLTMYESLLTDRTSAAYEYYSQMHGE